MSRIGLKPIPLPDKVQVDIRGSHVTVKGPKGELEPIFPSRHGDRAGGWGSPGAATDRSPHAQSIARPDPVVAGQHGDRCIGRIYQDLEIVGTGYRAEMQGENLVLHLGYSHPIEFEAPEGISF